MKVNKNIPRRTPFERRIIDQKIEAMHRQRDRELEEAWDIFQLTVEFNPEVIFIWVSLVIIFFIIAGYLVFG